MTSHRLSANIERLRPSATLAVNERSAQLQAEGKTVYRLGFGQSPFPVPSPVVDALRKAAQVKDYLPVQGLSILRQAVALFNRRTLGLSFSKGQILIGPGSKELIYHVQMALDADLLLPSPSWVSYEPQAELAHQKVKWLETGEGTGWRLSASVLNKACQDDPDRPKLLILNYPNNPTGTTYSVEELNDLADVCRKQNVIVVADEIYGEVHHIGKHHSLAQYYPEGTIVSSGLSKWCGAGGWRLGTMSFPKELDWLLKAMRVIASETFTSVSAPIQYAAVAAYAGGPHIAQYVDHSRRILGAIGQYVYRQLQALSITCPKPEGGFYLFPNFEKYRSFFATQGVTTSLQLCEWLLNNTGVALLPGSAFGRPEEEFTARLSFVDFDGGRTLEELNNNPNKALTDEWVAEYCPRIVAAMQALHAIKS